MPAAIVPPPDAPRDWLVIAREADGQVLLRIEHDGTVTGHSDALVSAASAFVSALDAEGVIDDLISTSTKKER